VNSGSPTKLGTQTPAACENAGPSQGRFQPGQSGNPAGRPRGSKSKLSDDFWSDMHEAWQVGGKDAINAMMREEPGRFIDCVARALPKDVNVRQALAAHQRRAGGGCAREGATGRIAR
jgi:hypothetical protein